MQILQRMAPGNRQGEETMIFAALYKANRLHTAGILNCFIVTPKGTGVSMTNPDDGKTTVFRQESPEEATASHPLPGTVMPKEMPYHFRLLYSNWFNKRRKIIEEN
jgi:hypothetical protein